MAKAQRCRKRLEHHRGASLILKFCNRTPDFRTKMEPIQHPLSTRPGSASRPVSSQRMPVIGESVSRARTWQHPVFSLPRQMIANPGMEVLPIHPALEGKISFSARFRTERKAQAGIPALNQRGNPQPSFAARHRPGATGEESPTRSPLFHAWPSSPDTPSSLLAAQVVWLLLGSLEGSHTGPGRAPPVPRSKDALLPADSLLNPSSSAPAQAPPPTPLPAYPAPRRRGVRGDATVLIFSCLRSISPVFRDCNWEDWPSVWKKIPCFHFHYTDKDRERRRWEDMNCLSAWCLQEWQAALRTTQVTKWFLRNVTVSPVTIPENPSILKLNLTNRQFAKQMCIYFYPESNYIFKPSVLLWSLLYWCDWVFFFLCCDKFSSTCIDDEDISYFKKFWSSWLFKQTNKRQINEVFNSYNLFCFPDHQPWPPHLRQGIGTELLFYPRLQIPGQ